MTVSTKIRAFLLRRKWRLISHPDSVNPFVASLVNYSCTARVHPITVGNETLIDWEGATIKAA